MAHHGNHIHLILSAKTGCVISNILRDFKKFTSKQIYQSVKDNPQESRKEWLIYMFEWEGKRNTNNKNFQVWRQDNHPIELSTPRMLKDRLDYLHENPVVAGIVYAPEEYVYGSGIDYYTTRKGRIRIEHLST